MPKILIANRGAIAVRIIRTLRQMQLETVAVYAEADFQSLHVRHADHSVSLGEGNAAATYLDGEKILQIARQHKVDAIHPGYGFLSENSDFVRLCDKEGIAFIGPTAEQIDAFGLKHRARELAKAQDVPLLEGSDILSSVDDALSCADSISYPVMLKSTAGGGGIGMQLCRNPEELEKHFVNVSELSKNNFSNADLFLEKFIERARHIEVQIFGDGNGNVISLGERDCSAQRRNQKVIEETPAPDLSQSTRDNLHEVARRLARAVNYRNAGTVEFILDADTDQFYFLEVNTRLQVEHGVTEMIYGIDLVSWMTKLALGENPLPEKLPVATGHAIQARVYAEDPSRNFRPSAGVISELSLPTNNAQVRIDHWIQAGTEISVFYDPMLAKVIVHSDNRSEAVKALDQQLAQFSLYGIETNLHYLRHLLGLKVFTNDVCLTNTLASIDYQSQSIEVTRSGTLTTVQDYPGRNGYWSVGIPPSGPFDDVSFRWGNRLLGNSEDAAGLELTLDGIDLLFRVPTRIVITGAMMPATLDNNPIAHGSVVDVQAGQSLCVGQLSQQGTRSYLLFAGGIDCPEYLGSRSTFTLGKFGGHNGRALRSGDILRQLSTQSNHAAATTHSNVPALPDVVSIHVTAGPHGTTEFFEQTYLDEFYSCSWKVHFNSSRTGVRLVGPQPAWSRETGGEAGMHPSNLHDNAYAFGTIDFTGDMPVILGPDGPSLGGFVCPATVATADRWKLGQLKAGDQIKFVPVTLTSAVEQLQAQNQAIEAIKALPDLWVKDPNPIPYSEEFTVNASDYFNETNVRIRRASDSFVLVEFGEITLDFELRFVVQKLLLSLEKSEISGINDLTPGIRSLQVHYDCLTLTEPEIFSLIKSYCQTLFNDDNPKVSSRIVHLPLSWDDAQCQLAIEKYDQVVRKDAPWYPSNLEFIRRINGLDSIEDVEAIVFQANYLVMGLGDVYLGAPVATPIDPRHRLVTTKYNPARTWTAENSVGIGGSYLCIYGMEGPGGYQFVGRTLQVWNIYQQTAEFSKPWLLRYFDQIKFFPVTTDELKRIRQTFPLGDYPLQIEETEIDLRKYKQFIQENHQSIEHFQQNRQSAFDEELERWKRSGQYQFEESEQAIAGNDTALKEGETALCSPVAGSVWKLLVASGDRVEQDQPVMVLESMKMEIEVRATEAGVIAQLLYQEGALVDAGSRLVTLKDIS